MLGLSGQKNDWIISKNLICPFFVWNQLTVTQSKPALLWTMLHYYEKNHSKQFSSRHWSFDCFYVIFAPLEYIPSEPRHSNYVIVSSMYFVESVWFTLALLYWNFTDLYVMWTNCDIICSLDTNKKLKNTYSLIHNLHFEYK